MGRLENIGVGLREFFIGLMIHLPYLILAAAFAAVLAFIIIKSRKRSERKKGAQAKETHVQENRGQEQEQTLQKKE